MKLKKELPLIVIVLLPFIYLAYIWNQLPEKVPMHWNINGEIDRYGDKMELILIPKNQSIDNPNYIVLSIGVLYIILGNYFKTIKANYFIGIRTPWTLENETVWKETHKLGGKMWFLGGIIVVLSSLILDKQPNLTVFLIVTGIITIIPIVYSYIVFEKEKKTA